MAPAQRADRPSADFLDWHLSEIFKTAYRPLSDAAAPGEPAHWSGCRRRDWRVGAPAQ
jgi:hypothetical protein